METQLASLPVWQALLPVLQALQIFCNHPSGEYVVWVAESVEHQIKTRELAGRAFHGTRLPPRRWLNKAPDDLWHKSVQCTLPVAQHKSVCPKYSLFHTHIFHMQNICISAYFTCMMHLSYILKLTDMYIFLHYVAHIKGNSIIFSTRINSFGNYNTERIVFLS